MNSSSKAKISKESQKLIAWYQQEKRDLPWRKSRNPYRIWLSEVMLQQTTVKAVIPYFNKFIKKFPQLEDLAQAPLEDVLELWAGLGYYSRARSLHKAAQALANEGGFPKSYRQLITYPGFGDYTSRAVSSLAFGERVGVVDGNVIRVLSRLWNTPWQHWLTKDKRELQHIADLYCEGGHSEIINQSFMELGATLCRPINPTCLLCPLKTSCSSRKAKTIEQLPLKKPKKSNEIWTWKVHILKEKNRWGLIKNTAAPFLKNQWLLPGKAKKLSVAPKKYDFIHNITHHKIYVSIDKKTKASNLPTDHEILWLTPREIKKKSPFSLIQKIIDTA